MVAIVIAEIAIVEIRFIPVPPQYPLVRINRWCVVLFPAFRR
jgi:hypothetical protein